MHAQALFPQTGYRQLAARRQTPAQPRFKLRLLTLAVLSAFGPMAMAATNHVVLAPWRSLPTGGVVQDPTSARIDTSTPNLMQINQQKAKAIINWSTFDIAKGYEVRFNQPNSSSEAMNYIGDSGPSVIQGTLSANGHVYLVNHNGILFDGSSQVNVNTLIASSLDISQADFNNGLLSSLVGKVDAHGNSVPTLVATMLLSSAGQVINYGSIRSVKVDGTTGQIQNNASGKPVEEGGAIMLFAPQVENHGLITANNGQVILAAGGTVYLQLYNDPTSSTYDPNDLSMRGFLVKVTAAPTGSLNVSQLIAAQNLNSAANIGGEIHSDRGNTTLTGMLVNQSGLVSASTAATVNGSIWLKAESYDATSGSTTLGTLTTGKGSVTETMPVDDGTTLSEGDAYTDNTLFNLLSIPHYQSVIQMEGQTVIHEGSAIAPGGRIEIGALSSRASQPGRVYLGADSLISVAGDWVDMPYSDNYLTFRLGSLDLANVPMQKGGYLINQTVTVDTRKGSPLLFDISGKVSAIARTVQAKATAGGSVTINTGEFISTAGSTVDVSGGGYRYANGMATTTYLVSNGHLYDIATAPVDLQYTGIVTRSLPVQGYVKGASAGVLAIDAKQMAIAGKLTGGTTVGPYQRSAAAMPSPGKLVLGTMSNQMALNLDLSTVKDGSVRNDLDSAGAEYALKNVTLGAGAATRSTVSDALAAIEADPLHAAAFPTALTDTVLLPVDLFGGSASSTALGTAYSGFGSLTIRASGDITVPQGVSLNMGPAGSALLWASQINVGGSILAQGGSLTFNQNELGTTHLGSTGVLSTAGGWINDTVAAGGSLAVPDVVNGGSVQIDGYASLDSGSRIDVSGGAMLGSTGTVSYGTGGSITLPTNLVQGVSLLGYSGTKGGSISLSSDLDPLKSHNKIDVGGASPTALSAGFFTTGGFTQYTLNGLAQVNFLTDVHPVADPRLINALARIKPTGTDFATISSVQSGLPASMRAPASLTANTGASISTVPYALNPDETGITVAPGVTLATDPLGHITLASQTLMDIEGSLVAPGGAISLSLDPKSKFFYDQSTGRFNTLRIGDGAVLSTAGVFLPGTGSVGLITGQVLPGGSITIKASKNDLDIAQGATLDVRGTRHAVDLQSGTRKGYTRTNVASEGGSISITATENAYLDGSFYGSGGDASVAGGSFDLNLTFNSADQSAYSQVLTNANLDMKAAAALAFMDPSAHQLQHDLVVTQSATLLARDGSQADTGVIGHLIDASGNFVSALHANISADQLVNGVVQGGTRLGGGFDQVALRSDNQILFSGNINNFAPRVSLLLDTPELRVQDGSSVQVGVGSAWQTAQLNLFNTPSLFRISTNLPENLIDQYPLLYTIDPGTGAKVPVATLGTPQVAVATQAGTGELTLSGEQISLAGNLTVNGTKDFNLVSSGDLRFQGFPAGYVAQNTSSDAGPLIASLQALTGRLSSAGNITLQADQVYPATAVNYTVAVESVSIDQLAQNQSDSGISASISRAMAADGLLKVTGHPGASLAPVYSAGGQLTLSADKIDQAGVIKAPLGVINLEGGRSVTLEPGSVTSVSALWNDNGVDTSLVIPYGATQSVGQSMWYGSQQVLAPPTKQINVSAGDVTVASGATVDIQGGGDIAAMEFVSGIGGTKDVLAAANTYAIIPSVLFQTSDSYLNAFAPASVSGATAYNMVHLAAGSGLPEGDYALLPAYYALVPGAYLVKVQSGAAYANMTPGSAVGLNNGAVVVAGKLGFSGTGITQSTWSSFSVQSGADALTNTPHSQGQYLVNGSQFFADQASKKGLPTPAMPLDGGQFSIGATGSLTFLGNLLAQAAIDRATGKSGAIGQVDLYGPKFAIVNGSVPEPADYVLLQADMLSRLNANLMIGGKRTNTSTGQSVDVVASDVIVDLQGGTLTSPELWLAATDNLTVSGSSNLVAAGTVTDRSGTLTINPDSQGNQYGALLGLSSGQMPGLARAGTLDTSSTHGNLSVAEGATLTATTGSILLDSTGTPQVNGVLNSTTLAIGARQIALGQVPAGGSAMVLGPSQLAALGSAKNFILRSYSTIDLYGTVALGHTGAGNFTFDSAGIVGHDVSGSAATQLSASQMTLENLSGTAMAASSPGTGSLTLSADKLVLADSGEAGFTVAGFNRVDVNAGEVSLVGKGALNVASDLNIQTARIAAGAGQVNQKVMAYDAGQQAWHAVTVTQPAGPVAFTDTPQPGGQLLIAGRSVDFGGNVDMQSGRVTLAAHGADSTDGVTLESGSRIDLSSYEKTFAQGTANITESVSAGRLTLSSDKGSVTASSGSGINLQGGAAGGDAGVLTVEAANGTVSLGGAMTAGAASGNQSGSASIDAANLGNFSDLNTALDAGGFNQSRYLRARTGDVDVAGTDTVTAHTIRLVADSGSVNVAGVLDASGVTGGGQVELDAGQGIHLKSTSRILANGTSTATGASDAYSDGGKVGLYARGAQLAFDSGALIDVSAAAAGKSSGGQIVFSAPRTADGQGVNASLAGQVKVAGGTVAVAGGTAPQAGSVTLEGFKRYDGITTTSAAAAPSSVESTDFTTFMNNADAMQGAALAALQSAGSDLASGNLKVRAGVELVGSGDMSVDSAWDLTGATWLPTGANQAGGRLVLRAAGNLAVNARLGLPNDTALPPASGWSMQLVGGADTASADAMAVKASTDQGDVTIKSGVKVTTSTGDIRIAAGRNFVEQSKTAIYTTGSAVTLPAFMSLKPLSTAVPTSGVNLVDGGDISISAQGNVTGSNDYADARQWLRRTSVANTTTSFAYLPAYWWVDRAGNSNAKTVGLQGIATLGGGNITIVAADTVSGLSVSAASSRSAATSATAVYEVNNKNYIPSANAVYGGGDVRIDAGGDILGGQYLVSRGTASFSAGGQVGSLADATGNPTAPAFWLMGWSDDPALQGAQVQIQALGNVAIGAVANPTEVKTVGFVPVSISRVIPGYEQLPSYFFSYSSSDSFNAQSTGGDVMVVGAIPGSPVATAGEVLPPRFSAVALEGNVSSGTGYNFDARLIQVHTAASAQYSPLYQYPDSNGQFQLLAGDSVYDIVLNASDYLPSSLTTPANQTLSNNNYSAKVFSSPQGTVARMVSASTLDGYRYAVVAEAGSVNDAAFYFPQQAVVSAGQDIANVQLDLQNLSATDVSLVTAGRDLYYTNILDNGSQWETMPHIQVSGPGNLIVAAGRDISLGAVASAAATTTNSSDMNNVTRIDSVGNTVNASLPTADAANLTLLSGVKTRTLGPAQIEQFFTVLRSVGKLQGLLGQAQSGSASTGFTDSANSVMQEANLAIDGLFASSVQPGSTAVHETLLDGNGGSAVSQLTAAYNGALAATNNTIAALFHDGQPHQGDISLYNARISSTTNTGGTGGNINLLAPFGNINVGLPTASSQRNIGIYTLAGGEINAYLNGDMNVNLSKVATFQGGDILLYTSGVGSTLDAGRGSRSARTTSPPRVVAEIGADGKPTGKLLLLPPLDLSGSGIRTVSYDPDGFGPLQAPDPGKVYLLAPTGIVDAGEAGVSSASGLVVAAVTVKNGDNFSAAGGSVGVPVVAGGPVAAPSMGDAASSASKAAASMMDATHSLADTSGNAAAFRPTFITAQVLGFGDGSLGSDNSEMDDKKKSKHPTRGI
jgi:filamentous hemagglutinin family protein